MISDPLAELLAARRNWHVELCDVRAGLAWLPEQCVQLAVTSPPYFGLRAYGTEPQTWGGNWRRAWCEQVGHWWEGTLLRRNRADSDLSKSPKQQTNKGIPSPADGSTCRRCGCWSGELGSEPTIEQYLVDLIEVFESVRRVLRDDGLLAVNLADSYSGSGKGPTGWNGLGDQEQRQGFNAGYLRANGEWSRGGRKSKTEGVSGIPAKNLLLIPNRFAIAMQAAGWIVRQVHIGIKRAPMPESVTDRATSAFEHVWIFSKRPTYSWDAEAVREQAIHAGRVVQPYGPEAVAFRIGDEVNDRRTARGFAKGRTVAAGRNLRNWFYWLSDPADYDFCGGCETFYQGPARNRIRKVGEQRVCSECQAADRWIGHYATFPPAVVVPFVKAGTPEHGCCAECLAPWKRVTDPAGWQPTCTCDAPRQPCLVLDPFSGTGSTGVAALSLGRRYLGLELLPDYVRLSRARLLAAGIPGATKGVTIEEAGRGVQTSLFDALEG